MTLRRVVLVLLAGSVFGALPVAAHQSADHGTLDVRSSLSDVMTDEVPHLACGPYLGATGLSATNGTFYALQAPLDDYYETMWSTETEYWWNRTDAPMHTSDGRPDDTAPVDFVFGPFTYLAPGYYEMVSYFGWGGDVNHSTPSVDFIIDGPCAPPVIPCPTGFAAALRTDGTVMLSWEEHPDHNGSFILRSVNSNEDWQFIGELPPGANGFHDTAAYAGATFHYLLGMNDDYGQACSQTAVDIPGPRTYFPCPRYISTWASDDAVYVDWYAAEGSDLSAVYRAEPGGTFESLATMPGLWGYFRDHNVTEGVAYRYTVNGRWAEGESVGCPVESLPSGWTFGYSGGEEEEDGGGDMPTGGLPDAECAVEVTLAREADGLHIDWTDLADVNATEIHRDAGADGDYESVFQVAPTSSRFLDEGADPETGYAYLVIITTGSASTTHCGYAMIAPIPNFASIVTAGLAVACGALGYLVMQRRRDAK